MNKDLLETQWVQIRGIIKEKFSNLSEEDIREINGRYDQLVTKLQQKYGYTREEAEERVRNWNFDRFTTTTNPNFREERVVDYKKNEDSSFYKWLLGLGIPLVLLGAYYLTSPHDMTTTTTSTTPTNQSVITQDKSFQETPADRTISTGLRNAFLSENPSATLQNVQISTDNGVVTLSGSVPSSEMRDRVVNAAKIFPGVTQVVNQIEVK